MAHAHRALRLVLVAALVLAPALGAQVPATDIYLVPLSVTGGKPAIDADKLVDITNRPGYDNQPFFTPDGKAILFTSIHDDAQADIYRYDLTSRSISRVTTTPESEYSANVTPDGKRFSVIRVEKDSAQRLWSFNLDGTDPKVVVANLAPVGYHAWINDHELALFVLGRPNALVHVDTRTGRADTLTRNIGRSLAALPGGGFSYVQIKDSSATLVARTASGATTELVKLPAGGQDIVWLDARTVLASSGTKILGWRRGEQAWSEIADLARLHLKDVTRLAVSRDGKWLAVVATPNP